MDPGDIIVSLGLVGALLGIYADAFNFQIKAIDAQAVAVVESDAENKVVELADSTTDQAESQAVNDASSTVENANLSISSTSEKEGIPAIVVIGVLVGLMMFISAHALGQACVWVFLNEIFPNRGRG